MRYKLVSFYLSPDLRQKPQDSSYTLQIWSTSVKNHFHFLHHMELKDTHMALNKDSLTASYGLWNYYLIELNGTYKDSLIWNLQWFSYKNKILRHMKLIKCLMESNGTQRFTYGVMTFTVERFCYRIMWNLMFLRNQMELIKIQLWHHIKIIQMYQFNTSNRIWSQM